MDCQPFNRSLKVLEKTQVSSVLLIVSTHG